MPEKPQSYIRSENLSMLPIYFDYIFVHLRQKVRFRPELSPQFVSTLGPNPARTRPERPGPTYNSVSRGAPIAENMSILFIAIITFLAFFRHI